MPIFRVGDQVGNAPVQAVELSHDEHVVLPQGPQAPVNTRPVVLDVGREVVVDVGRVDDGRF